MKRISVRDSEMRETGFSELNKFRIMMYADE